MSEHLHILQHSLGLDAYGRGNSYRRHFAAYAGTPDHATCESLVEQGLMEAGRITPLTGGAHVFLVTEAGRQYVAEHSPVAPKLTAGERRYQAYLTADPGVPFGTWLRGQAAKRRELSTTSGDWQ